MSKKIVEGAGSLLKEFRNFAVKGNVFDLAIAVVVGGAFGKIVSSLVADIITPTLALITGGTDFKELSVLLRSATDTSPAVVLTYGAFLQSILDFLLIAVSIFLVFKIFSIMRERMFQDEETVAENPHEKPAQERLLEEIRDLLKEQK